MESDEGSSTASAFWQFGVMALAGNSTGARPIFERLLDRANDLGLFPEEIDTRSGEQRGNVLQAFTHMRVINHAVRLEQAAAHSDRRKDIA
jgi:GH15 family glucan-1,4-alpha-glucosidase